MDFVQQLGEFAIVSRLKRLAERMHQDNMRVFKELGIPFEVRWFLVLKLLRHQPNIGIMDMAQALGIKHPTVIQLVAELSEKGYVKTVLDKSDKRRRIVTLTKKGSTFLEELEPIWQNMQLAAKDLIKSTQYDVLAVLSSIESELDKESYYYRMRKYLHVKKQKSFKVISSEF